MNHKKSYLLSLLIIPVLAIALGMANALRTGTALIAKKTNANQDYSAFLPEGIQTADTETILSLSNSKNTVLVDARSKNYFDLGHIPGATNWYSDDIQILAPSIEKDVPYTTAIYIYCDGGDCGSSLHVAKYLKYIGYTEVYVYLGGIQEWLEKSLPIQSSP